MASEHFLLSALSLLWCSVSVPHSSAPIHFLFNTGFLHSLTRTQAPESTKARSCCRKASSCPHGPGKAEGSPLVVLCHGYLNPHLPGWLQALNEPQKQRTEQERGGRRGCESVSSASLRGFCPPSVYSWTWGCADAFLDRSVVIKWWLSFYFLLGPEGPAKWGLTGSLFGGPASWQTQRRELIWPLCYPGSQAHMSFIIAERARSSHG